MSRFNTSYIIRVAAAWQVVTYLQLTGILYPSTITQKINDLGSYNLNMFGYEYNRI